MERQGRERFSDHQELNPNSYSGNSCPWPLDDHRPNFSDKYHHHRRRHQLDQMNGEPGDLFGGQPPSLSGRKRGFPRPAPDPPLFEEHGNIIEVVLPRDKRTGQQQGYCFVKYVTFEEAGRAIRAQNNHYIFPGVSSLAAGIATKKPRDFVSHFCND